MPKPPSVKPLLKWYQREGRDLPWRNSGDPYLIWVSEIILQQTRVVQGKPYYDRFIQRFPDVFSLAEAGTDEVMKYWEGLGYYARARNLHAAAKEIVQKHKGIFPNTSEQLSQLKGIGPYTSRAIASFAFGEKSAVLDGNVFRVLSRLFADEFCIDSSSARNYYQNLADTLMGNAPSGQFNQAMMDLGAMICKPGQPECGQCPLHNDCMALSLGIQTQLPVRKTKSVRPVRTAICYAVYNSSGEIWIRRRPESGLWGGLYELPWFYEDEKIPLLPGNPQGTELGTVHHIFTHFELEIKIIKFSLSKIKESQKLKFTPWNEVEKLAFPKAMHKVFKVLRNK